jgi:hypothetical protein
MVVIDDFVARIEGTCGKQEDIIVTFKYNKKDEALKRILERATVAKSIARIVFDLTFRDYSFRLYGSGKAIFRDLKSREELNSLLSDLLL